MTPPSVVGETMQRMAFDSSYTTCQVPRRDGAQCFNEPDPRNPWGVCRTHWEALARSWQPTATVDDPRRVRCLSCGQLTALTRDGKIAFCADPECKASFEVLQVEEAPVVDVVYYMRFDRRVKIGTTTNLLSRAKSVYHDEVLAVEPGGTKLERQRHQQFAHLLINGQREWFHAESALLAHAGTLRKRHGDPFTACEGWYRQARSIA